LAPKVVGQKIYKWISRNSLKNRQQNRHPFKIKSRRSLILRDLLFEIVVPLAPPDSLSIFADFNLER
jgi:hypothetical protein